MQRTPVSSSNLCSIGYDGQNGTLEIEFLGGGIYQYYGVPATIHAALMSAASHGTFFNAHIKGRYGDTKVS